MSNFRKNISPHVESELKKSEEYLLQNQAEKAFKHLENAHVLAQESTYLHVLIHIRMARWAIYQKDFKELLGQILRIVGAATKTAMGLVPTGNTGGSNISPFKTLPLCPEHKQLIAQAKQVNIN